MDVVVDVVVPTSTMGVPVESTGGSTLSSGRAPSILMPAPDGGSTEVAGSVVVGAVVEVDDTQTVVADALPSGTETVVVQPRSG